MMAHENTYTSCDGVAGASADQSTPHIDSAPVYFERQLLLRCGVHALNNLLGKAAFTADALDEIANTIAGTPYTLLHRWPLVGNWDVNVILMALQAEHLTVTWWDERKSFDALSTSRPQPVSG